LTGGASVHRVCWVLGADFKQIGENYVSYVRKHYGTSYIVFDGYESQTTKSSEHLRRNGGMKCHEVDLKENIKVLFSKEKFLGNVINKSKLIKLISQHLKDDGNIVINCLADADTKICATALKLASSSSKKLVVVGRRYGYFGDADISLERKYERYNIFSATS
jgi:hypothetical protein